MKVTIMIGVPGSGKTTMANKLSKKDDAVVLSYEEIRKELIDEGKVDKEYRPEQKNIVYEEQFKRCENFVRLGKSIIVDATNISETNRKPIFERLKKYNPVFIAYVMLIEESECAKRINQKEIDCPTSIAFSSIGQSLDVFLDRLKNGMPKIEEGFTKIYINDNGKVRVINK